MDTNELFVIIGLLRWHLNKFTTDTKQFKTLDTLTLWNSDDDNIKFTSWFFNSAINSMDIQFAYIIRLINQ